MKYRFNEFDMSKAFFHSTIFMLGSTHYFKDNMLKELRNKVNATNRINLIDGTELRSVIKRVQHKPFSLRSSVWLVYIEYDRLQSKHIDMLFNYLKTPSRYALFIINSKDYKKRSSILRSPFFDKLESVAVLDFEYPSRKYIQEYIKTYLEPKVIGLKEIKLILDRLALKYDEYGSNLNFLKSVPDKKITRDIIHTLVQDLSSYGIDKLVSMLVLLDRKTLPIHALNDLLAENTPSQVLGMIKKCFGYIQEAKFYEMRGLLAADGNINEDKKHIQIDTNKKGLLNLPNKYINRYLLLARSISSVELAYIGTLLAKFRWINKDDVCGDASLYCLILSILARRQSTTIYTPRYTEYGMFELDDDGKPVYDVTTFNLTMREKLELLQI